MKAATLLILTLMSVMAIQGQSPDIFRARLGNPDKVETKDSKVITETYSFPPDFNIVINYSDSQAAQSLRILPKKSQLADVASDPVVPQKELQAALDKIVPLADRGKFVMSTFLHVTCLPKNDCRGVEWAYKKVSIYYNSGNGGMRYAEVSWKTIKR